MSVAPEAAATKTGDEATRLIRELAEEQHGVVARRQLLEIGLGAGLVQERRRSGRLIPVHRGVFAVGHSRIGRKGAWMAAVLASGQGAVLSHGSAADLWGLRRSRGPIEVTRRSGGGRGRGVRVHQSRLLSAADVTTEAGIPVTSLEQTLFDMSGRLDGKQLERLLVAADRSGRLRWPQLERILDERTGRPSVARLRRVAQRVDPRAVDTKSPLEVDFLALCRDAGLPRPEVNVFVEGHLVDFLWVGKRVVVETDGYTYHADRPSFESDHERTAVLMAAGYVVHRATIRMLIRDPDLFLGNVRRSLQG
ncbi:MAG: type IV toxin-antitoxin system AbiEi family antitoxin domain-containing protein [Solirubrobacterales bacterium]